MKLLAPTALFKFPSLLSMQHLLSACSLQCLDCESGRAEGPSLVPSSPAPSSHPCGQAKGWLGQSDAVADGTVGRGQGCP